MHTTHEDHPEFSIHYKQEEVERFLGDGIYNQINKVFGIKIEDFHSLMRTLDNYTMQKIQKYNKGQGKISCLKRPNVRAIMLDTKGELILGLNNDFIIGTNNIERTELNNQGTLCIRQTNNVDSAHEDKNDCATYCYHKGCAEKKLIDILGDKAVKGGKIILFGHTDGPCKLCCNLCIEKEIVGIIIGSPPPLISHKHYDEKYAETRYKMFKNNYNY